MSAAAGSLDSPPVGQRPVPKPRKKLPPMQSYDVPRPIYDVPRPIYDAPRPISQTSSDHQDTEQPQSVVLRNRSESFTSGQRPQPKPRKARSVMFGGTASADSSPQVPRPENKRLSMQPTPLIQALSGQLLNQLRASERTDQTSDTSPETSSKKVEMKQGKKDKLKMWSISRVFPRSRAHSSASSKKSPTKPSTSKERPITISASQQGSLNSGPSNKSKTLPANLRYAGFPKRGTPVPNRPAPPPPYASGNTPSGINDTTPVYEELDKDQTGNDYVQETAIFDDSPTSLSQTARGFRNPPGGAIPPLPPRSTPPTTKPKHRLLDHTQEDTRKDTTTTARRDTTNTTEAEQDTGIYEPVRPLSQDSDTSGEESEQEPGCGDGTQPVYEDLDQDDDYPIKELVEFGKEPSPKKEPAKEALPQVPPHSTPPAPQWKHRLLSGKKEGSKNDRTTREEEPEPDTGVYEPVSFPMRDSDSEEDEESLVAPNFAASNPDGTYPVYEDLDKDDDCGNDYSMEPTLVVTSNQTASPALPTKKGAGEDVLPQLPPRSTQPVVKRKHRLLQPLGKQLQEENRPATEEKEAEQDTGTYETIPPLSQESDESDYTPMSGGTDKGEGQENCEDDQPESMYIEMDNVSVQLPNT